MVWLLSQHIVVCVLLAALVAIVSRAFRLSPAARHALWFIVLLKVLLPLPVSWPWEIPGPSVWFAKAPTLEETPLSAGPTIQIPALPRDVTDAGVPPATSARATKPVAPRFRMPELTVENASRGALTLWALASAAILATQFIKHTRYLRKSRANRPTPEWLSRIAARISGQLGIPTPEIRVAENAPSPYVHGLLRERLIIPEALLDAVPRERWDCILTHELAHLKRRDHWVRWVELIAGGVWFWNPVYWIARRSLRANAELACDAWVIRTMPDRRRAYAETLIDVSELVSKGAVPVAALGIGARGVRIDFERRLTMILHASDTQRTTWKAAVLGVALAIAALPGWSQAKSSQTTAAAPPANAPSSSAEVAQQTKQSNRPTIDEALRAPVSIEFDGTHLSKIVEFLADYAGTNIVIDYRAVKPARNANIPPKGALWASPAPNPRTAEPYVSNGMLHEREYKAAKPSAILDDWAKELQLTYRILPARVFISTKEQMEKDGALLDTDAIRLDINQALTRAIDFSNAREHIAAAAERLSGQIGAPITIDSRIIAPPDAPMISYAQPMAPRPAPPMEPVADDPDLDRLYTTDGIVNAIKLEDVPLVEALEALTTPLNLTYAAKPNFIWITSRERAAVDEFADPPVPLDAEAMAKALQNSVNIEFDNTHISRILEFIADYININIVLDQRAVPGPLAGRRSNTPYMAKVGDKYAPTGYVPYIKLEDVPLKEALKALFIPLGLTCKVDKYVVYVSTPQLLADGSAPHDAATKPSSPVSPTPAAPERSETQPEEAIESQPRNPLRPQQTESAAGDAPASKPAPSSIEEALSTPISIEFDNAHISVITRYIAKSLGRLRVNLLIDPRAVKPAPVAVVGAPGFPGVPGAPLPAPGSPTSPVPPPIQPTEPTDPAIEAMYVTDGVVPYVKLVDVPLGDVLSAILRPLDLAYEVRPYFIWITSKDRLNAAEWPDAVVPDSGPFANKLNASIAFEFDNAHITRIIEFLGDYLKVEFKFDARAVPPAFSEQPGQATPVFTMKDGKPSPTGYVSYIAIQRAPLGESLKALLVPMGLTYYPGPGYLIITSPDLARDTKPEEWANIPYLTDGVPATAQPVPAKPAATGAKPVNDTSEPVGIRLIRIVKWSDGGYRAEIASDLSSHFRRYAEGEQFEHFKVRSIHPQAGTVTVYSSRFDKEFVLSKQF